MIYQQSVLINVLDLFSGIGGFRLGLLNAGFKFNYCGYSEIDKYAKQIYKKHFPASEDLGDVKTIRTDKIPKLDLITFGFPCQDLSVSGKRAGIQAPRSGLFFEAMRIVRDARPTYFIFENVKGLFSSSNGECWKSVLKEIANAGYDGQWQLLNTGWFLPQSRERIFFVGHFREQPRPQIFPVGESNQNNEGMGKEAQGKRERVSTKDICPSLTTGEKWKAFIAPTLCHIGGNDYMGQRIYAAEGISSSIQSRGGQGLYQIGLIGRKDSEATRVYSSEGISRTIKNGGGQGAKTGLYQTPRGKNKGGWKKQCGTLSSSSFEHNNFINGIRRLTPLECERLQGFPDGYTEGISDSQRYKCLGNAVSIPVVKCVGEKLLKAILKMDMDYQNE